MMNTLLIVSMSLCAFSHIIPAIIKHLISWLYAESCHERLIRSEMQKLEHEMQTISMVDEFAKYTRIQRKHLKLRQEFKDQMSVRFASRSKAQLFLTYGAKIFNSIVLMQLIRMHRNEPVVAFPEGTLWPLGPFFNWPGLYEDSISMLIWVAISTVAISAYKEISA